MKSILTLIMTLTGFATTSLATATLRIPVQFEGTHSSLPAREINEKLKALGAPLVPEFIEISTGEDGYKKFQALDAQIEKLVKPLGNEGKNLERGFERVPGSNDKIDLKTCYLGAAKDVANIVSSLADVAYSDQLVLYGYKFKKQTQIFGDDQEGTEKFLNEGSKLWKEWRGQGMAILITASVTDDGNDIRESLIYLCK